MRVLIACEESQVICKAFRLKGHEAYSCDLQECSGDHPEWHLQKDVFNVIDNYGPWDLMIAHPPCTYLTVTGNKWFKPEYKDRFPDREERRKEAIKFFMKLANCNIPKYCIENPVGVMSTLWRKPTQIIQPFYFGHPEPKKTCLWLRGLKKLNGNMSYALDKSTCEPEYTLTKSGKKMATWYFYADKSNGQEGRAKIRSKTFQGIADAMANQWG